MRNDAFRAKNQLKKNIDFLRSTHTDAPSELDLTS
jgi:hypothetical protein